MKKYAAEALGTFALVFAGTGAIVINEASSGAITHAGIALTFGLVVLALVVLMAGTYWVMSRALYGSFSFSLLAPVSLVFGIAACLFQGFGMWHLGFGLTQGGYASVFAGLTGAWLIQLLGAVAWLATVVVQGRPSGDTVVRPHSAATFGWILVFLAAVGVINYLLLYLVK